MFGDGNKEKCQKCVFLPAVLGSTNCFLKVEVVPGSLPLLLGVNSMKRTGMDIILHANEVKFADGSSSVLEILPSGHCHRNYPSGNLHNCALCRNQIERRESATEITFTVWSLPCRQAKGAG